MFPADARRGTLIGTTVADPGFESCSWETKNNINFLRTSAFFCGRKNS